MRTNRSVVRPRAITSADSILEVERKKDIKRKKFHYREVLANNKDSLWSVDLFRCESAGLRTHWIMVVMDQYTRRIIGFGQQARKVDGNALCRMFNHALRGQRSIPKYLSSDNDPLYRFPQWQANLRILDVAEIKTVPYVPLSHPFVSVESAWIGRCSGQPPISNASCSISRPISTIIARIAHGRGDHPTRHRLGRSRTSNFIDGNLTAEDCIKPR
jgi:hypothetical protein